MKKKDKYTDPMYDQYREIRKSIFDFFKEEYGIKGLWGAANIASIREYNKAKKDAAHSR